VERSRKSLDLLASLSTNLGRWAKTLSADHSEAATSASISGAPASDAAREALDQALSSEAASTSSGGVPLSPKLTSEKEALIDLWLRLSVGLGRICLDQREVRRTAYLFVYSLLRWVGYGPFWYQPGALTSPHSLLGIMA
jgi:hypothetical protein